jgi:uncharacterized protein YndB with AHSA1/START domain
VAALVAEATGARELPEPPAQVWEALAVLRPYCAVCDVSYLVTGSGRGATFVCVPGRVDGDAPAPRGTTGEIVEWAPPRRVTTRLERAGEIWTTRLELTPTASGGTQVGVTLHCETTGTALVGALQRRALQRLVDRTVEGELARLSDHVAAVG